MDQNYGEIICTAIDEIVTAKLQGLEYDVTKLCTVVDDTQSHKGKYVVTDGTSKYEANSTDTTYRNGNNVLVTIPNGDYNLQKIIVCRVSADDTTPFNYTSPMNTMLKITNNIFDDANVVHGENLGLLANESNKSTTIGPIYSLTEPTGFAGFTRLGVTANFKSLLNGLDVATGTYGLKFLIYTETSTSPGVKNNTVYELSFNSTDMIGNPYQFESYFYQEKVFDISSINNIKQIDVYFYQNGKFYDGDNKYIDWQYQDSLLGSTKFQNNLFVNDVKIYLGYDVGEFTEETLLLHTNDSLKYHYSDNPLYREIGLRWVHKIDDNTYKLLNLSDLNDEFEIRWFKYHIGYEAIDKYAGNNWEEINPLDGSSFIDIFHEKEEKLTELKPENFESIDDYYAAIDQIQVEYEKELSNKRVNSFNCTFVPNKSLQTEQIKVIGLQKTIIGEDKETKKEMITITPYYSNLLIFENENHVPDAITNEAASALSIVCEDDSSGNYYIYNQNGKLENVGNGKGNKRYLKAMYQGAEITSSLGLGVNDFIKWYIPKEKTMLEFSDDYFSENEGIVVTNVKLDGVDYVEITRNTILVRDKYEFPSTKQAYSISDQWNYEKSNNTIRCIVHIQEVEHKAIEELRFGKAGTNGTNVTFLIEFENNQNALIVNSGNTKNKATLRARLYDANGANLGFAQSQANSIQWSWHRKTESDNPYMFFNQGPISDQVVLTCNTSEIPADNYFILKATYGDLEAYLPIPLKTEKTSHIEGAREVIYNNLGNPSYYSDAYVMYYYNGDTYEEAKETVWDIKYDEDCLKTIEHTDGSKEEVTDVTVKSYIPDLKALPARPGYKGLYASSFYAKGYNDLVCVYGIDKETGSGWSQPILIMQSKYDFAMLNQWDGKLTLDENNGTILTTMLGAGRKNSNNTFSGVLIGDLEGTGNTVDTDTATGVYGLHEGVTSFALKEDGTATFGKKGKGQIFIDGNASTIESASYRNKENKYGMQIDLDAGQIHILGDDKSEIKIQPNSKKGSYFNISSNTNVKLINISADDYFLQSNNYTIDGAHGTKLDLKNGTLEIKSPYGCTNFSSQESDSYFKISVPPLTDEGKPGYATGVSSYAPPILEISKNDYYLKSLNYDGLAIKTTKINGKDLSLYNNGDVAVYIQDKDNINIYDKVTNPNNTNGLVQDDEGVYWKEHPAFTETQESRKTYDDDGKEKTEIYKISAEKNQQAYLAALTPYYSKNKGSGLKLDLQKGLISGYDLLLKGTKSNDTSKTITIDSSNETTPLKIGPSFSVNWDGTLTCNKLNSLTSDGRTDRAISINNNFYVTKGGGAGGSGVSFSGGFSGGFSGTGSGLFKGEGQFEKLTVTSSTDLTGSFKLTSNGSVIQPRSQVIVSGFINFKKATVDAYTSLTTNQSNIPITVSVSGSTAGHITSSGYIPRGSVITGGDKTTVMTGVSFTAVRTTVTMLGSAGTANNYDYSAS